MYSWGWSWRVSVVLDTMFSLGKHCFNWSKFLDDMDDTNLDKTLSSRYIMPTFPIRSQCTLSLPPWKHQKTVRFSDVFWGQIKGALGTNGLIGTFEPRLRWDIKSIFLPRTWTTIIYKEQLKCKLILTVACTWKLQNSILMCPSKIPCKCCVAAARKYSPKIENWRKLAKKKIYFCIYMRQVARNVSAKKNH